jgi:GTP-binding protein
VDASEGLYCRRPASLLRKALEAKLPVILVVNKVDRPDQDRGGRERAYELFLDLDADEARSSFRSLRPGPARPDCSRTSSRTTLPALRSAARADPGARIRPRPSCRRSSRTSTPRRTWAGAGTGAARDDQEGPADRLVPRRRDDRAREGDRALRGRGARPGRGGRADRQIVAVAGLPEVTIGETLADSNDPRPLPVSTVDEPSLSMTVGINTSRLGREGDSSLRAC